MKYFLRNSARRPRDTSPHVSLFPFLAVLICTMGALVPLLFTISRQARLQAEKAAAAKAIELKADVKVERETVQWRIEQMQTSKKKTEAEIETARLELGHLEDHSRRLKAKIAELEKTIAEIEHSGNEEKHAATAAELEELQKQITVAERQLAEAKAQAAGKKRSFAIIPYEGPNSTHRRPIYIECRGDAVILQPEGIMLSAHDFEGPMGPNIPLAAALRSEREYLLSQKGFDPQRDGEPYPLLLVRPDGIIAYYAARAAMKSWGPEFGYELIDADWKLAYQPPDSQLARVVYDAVESARMVQERLIAAAPRQYAQRSSSSTARGSSSRGGEGYGSASGSGTEGIAGGSSRGLGSSPGHGGSRGSGISHGGSGTGFGGAVGGSGGDSDSWDDNPPMPSGPDPFLAGVNNPYASLAVGGSGAAGSGAMGLGATGTGATGLGATGTGATGTGAMGSGAMGTGPGGSSTIGSGAMGAGTVSGGNGSGVPGSGVGSSGPVLGNANGMGETGSAMGLSGANGNGASGNGGIGASPAGSNGMASGGGYPQGVGQTAGAGSAQGSEGSQCLSGSQANIGASTQGVAGSAGNATGSQGNNPGQQTATGNGNPTAGQGTLFPIGQGTAAQGTASTGQMASAGEAGTQAQKGTEGQGGATGQSKRSTDPPDIFASRMAASNAAKKAGDNQSTTTSSGTTKGQVVAPLRPGEWREKPEPPPETHHDPMKGRRKESPAKQRGQDWGLRDTAQGAVPITRPVIVECQADRVMIMPEPGRGGSPMVVMASGSDSTIDDLVSAIWDRMSRWGMAGRGMYWRPVLHVRVTEGGEQRFSDLQVLLQNSGLDVVRR